MAHPTGVIMGERLSKALSIKELNHSVVVVDRRKKLDIEHLKAKRKERNSLRIKDKLNQVSTNDLLQELAQRNESLKTTDF